MSHRVWAELSLKPASPFYTDMRIALLMDQRILQEQKEAAPPRYESSGRRTLEATIKTILRTT